MKLTASSTGAPRNLGGFPAFVTAGHSLWRAHRTDGPVLRFSTAGTGRFDPPQSRSRQYGTCYLSSSTTDAFLEKFGRLGPYLTDGIVRHTAVTEIMHKGEMQWADLTNAQAVSDYFTGYDPFLRSDFHLSQDHGYELRQAGFDGIRYRASHYGATESDVFALFGPPGDIPVGGTWGGFEVLKEALMDDVLRDMETLHAFFVLASNSSG